MVAGAGRSTSVASVRAVQASYQRFRPAPQLGRYEPEWRRGPESNRRIGVLQTPALPLGYRAPKRWSGSAGAIPRFWKDLLKRFILHFLSSRIVILAVPDRIYELEL